MSRSLRPSPPLSLPTPDTAAIYRNEEAVGAGIRASGVPRDQLFVTTKLPPTQFGADKAPQGLRDSVARLALADTTVDLILLHWPGTAGYKKGDERHAQRRRETYQALLDAQTAGLCRYAGVSNYTVRHLEELEAQGLPMPVVNQVELHPRLPQTQLRQWCSSRGIVVQAYSPLGCGDLVKHPMVSGIAKQLGRSVRGGGKGTGGRMIGAEFRILRLLQPAQVLLRWLRQQDIPFVVKSVCFSC